MSCHVVKILFLVAVILYSYSAALPYLVKTSTQLIIAPIIGILTALTWVGIARSISPTEVPWYGIIYDVLLTSCFFIVPYFFIPFNLKIINITGVLLVLVGLVLLKV